MARSEKLPLGDMSPQEIERKPLLQHVALVMDGNRRWAKLHGKLTIEGHVEGRERIEPIVKRAQEIGIEVVTFYTLSLENLKRTEEEVEGLFELLRDGLEPLVENLKGQDVRFQSLGDIDSLPSDIRATSRQAEETSKEKSGIGVNLALAYGGRDEIVRAFRRIVRVGVREEDITEELVNTYLDTAGQPDPDLVIRTGGRKRLSNYLPWQTVYSEIYFTDVLWPDFTIEEFNKAVSWYNEQTRTFGR